MPVRALLVGLVAAVLAGEARPEVIALLESSLPSPYPPYLPSHLDLCLRVGTKVEVPRRVLLLAGIGRDHNDGLPFREPEDRSGSGLAALSPSCSEENHWAFYRAGDPSTRGQ